MSKTYFMQSFYLLFLCLCLSCPSFAQEEAIIVEDFDDEYPIGWLVEDNSNATSFVRDGVFHLNNKVSNQSKGYFKTIEINSAEDYSIELKLLQKSGESDIGYGLVWNRQSENDYLYFKITLDGKARIEGKQEGKDIVLMDWKKLKKKDIKRMGQSQILTIEKTEKNTTFLINDNKLFVTENQPLTGHQIGVFMDNQMETKVDYFRIIHQPKK